MKFGKELEKQKVPEWTEAYVDYNGLKRILQEIRNSKENKPNRPRASQKRLSLFMDFGASSGHASNLEKEGDIENQVIAVDTVQEGNSRKFYNTKLLVSSGDGEENESIFFKTLVDELNKTNNFYKDKVDEAIEEAALLKKQMEVLVVLRIKVNNPNFDGSSSLKCLSMDISNLAPSKIIPPARSKTVGIRVMDRKLGVEMFGAEVDLSCQHQHSNSHPNNIPCTENYNGAPIDGETTNESKSSHLEILDRVKISNTFDDPISTIKGVLGDSKEKELSCNKEELKEVEERLKVAFIQLHQKLCHLKHYSFMNLLAFSKILKKYDKITSRSVARSYMKIVDNSYIGSCDMVNSLMEKVEVVFIKNFLRSNRREGMKLLRPKQKIEKHRVTFFSGFFCGCSVALLVAVVLLVEDRKLMPKSRGALYMRTVFPLYSLFTYVVLHMLVYAANIYFWRHYKINYRFIFGFKQGTELGHREVFLLGSGLAMIVLAAFLIHFHIKMDSTSQHYETYIELLPLGLVIVVIAITFCPFNIIYRSSRFFFIKCVFRCLCAPLYKVRLPDFFLADQFTSQVQAIRSLEYYICFYGWGRLSQRLNRCSNHDLYNVFYFIVGVIPYWFRFLQCIRRLFEERDFAHGYNGLRYFLTIIAVVIRTAFELRKKVAWKLFALVSSAIAAIANTYWDIVVDWGLLQRKSENLFLRDKLLITHKSVYFTAMVLDVFLRFAWLQLVLTLDVHSLQGNTISTIFSCLEILRRGLWNFFRLENEHLNNVGKYRAFKSVPLPFTYYEDEDEDDDIDKDN
ncbi:phosphate transporter PHO1 homolog 10 [Sesamum indicum]|uniref:Phosphate transporter PHO1 homolog 10 n=1 Tax=Sesamum indicum TaxID=4182 RepID=A0A6I9SXP9_SESIN|nr:phosphate transporter PHO1 homolog 10 [Sesamum indicum]